MKDIFDEDVKIQPKQKRKLRERDIQEKCVAFARANGFWARKFSSPANRSVPDYLFAGVGSGGRAVKLAVEFKAPGKKSTSAQLEEQQLMCGAGWIVWFDVGFNGEADIVRFKKDLLALLNPGFDAFPG